MILKLKKIIFEALKKNNIDYDLNKIIIEQSKNINYGDYSTNIAFKIKNIVNIKPIDIANKINKTINKEMFEKIEVVEPGFINFFIKKNVFFINTKTILNEIIKKQDNYGKGKIKNKKINIEFVSANPTGYLHVGHVRGAIFGDVLSRIMLFAGYDVTREYYVNNIGNQINKFSKSIYQRYLQLFDNDKNNKELSNDTYRGKDIIEIAKYFKKKYGNKLLKNNIENLNFFKHEGIKKALKEIKKDLKKIKITMDIFSFETKICTKKKIKEILQLLNKYVYDKNNAKFIKTSAFFDDKDRAIIKKDGKYTYFLPDIAYHFNKINRNYDLLIDILGADHHGYINRLKSIITMLNYKPEILKIILIQMVKFVNNGKEIKISKRSGNSITLKELLKKINVNVIRYFFISRDNNTQLDFNYSLAMSKSSSNPVYYVMYAYTRLNSIIEFAKKEKISINYCNNLLKENEELKIIEKLQEFPIIIETISKNYKINKLINYVYSLATLIHYFYNKFRIIDKNHIELSANRLKLVLATKIVLNNSLKLLGIDTPNKM